MNCGCVRGSVSSSPSCTSTRVLLPSNGSRVDNRRRSSECGTVVAGLHFDTGFYTVECGLAANRCLRTILVAVGRRIVVELQVGTDCYRRTSASSLVGFRTMLVAVERRVVGLQFGTGLCRGAVVSYVVGSRTMLETVERRIVVSGSGL